MAEDLVDKIYQQADGPVDEWIASVLDARSELASSIDFVKNPDSWEDIELKPKDIKTAIITLRIYATRCAQELEELICLCKQMTSTPSETPSKPNSTL